MPSSAKSKRGSHINSNTAIINLSQGDNNVNNNSMQEDDKNTSEIKYAIDDDYGMFDDLFEGETEEEKAERWHELFPTQVGMIL